MRSIATIPARRNARTHDDRPECLMMIRANLLFTGMAVSTMVRYLVRERR